MIIFIHTNGTRKGPYSADQLRELIARGDVSMSDKAWHDEGCGEWTKIQDMPELLSLILPPLPNSTVDGGSIASPAISNPAQSTASDEVCHETPLPQTEVAAPNVESTGNYAIGPCQMMVPPEHDRSATEATRAPHPSGSANFLKTVRLGLVCLAVVIGLWIWKSSSNVVTLTAADGTKVRVNVGAIESVLKQDSKTGAGAETVATVVDRMRGIDTAECPSDFQAAYLAHIHAWESMAQVERDAKAFKADREGAGDMVEGFIRGFLGDPFGKANEIQNAQGQLQRQYQLASEEVRLSFNQVEELAVKYGARLPKQ